MADSDDQLALRRKAQNTRKQKSRSAIKAAGLKRVEVKLSAKAQETLARNCALRGGNSGAYTMVEYIESLIRKDDQQLKRKLRGLGECEYCGEGLPEGCGGQSKGQKKCWLTKGEAKLSL